MEFLRERYKVNPQSATRNKNKILFQFRAQPLTKNQDWNPTVKALTELTPSLNLYPNFAGDALQTWVFGTRATLAGDAAHAHGGAFAAGGSLALDDSLALGLAFKHVFSGKTTYSGADIEKALRLYSRTRLPHTARLLRIVHGQIDKKQADFETAEAEDDALVRRLKGRPDTEWLSEHDVEAAFGAVVGLEEAQRVRASGEIGALVQRSNL